MKRVATTLIIPMKHQPPKVFSVSKYISILDTLDPIEQNNLS